MNILVNKNRFNPVREEFMTKQTLSVATCSMIKARKKLGLNCQIKYLSSNASLNPNVISCFFTVSRCNAANDI